MTSLLLRLFGWYAALFLEDPSLFDRWTWLRLHLQSGPSRTLDAGCGFGALTFFASEIGNEVIGLSFDRMQIRRARSRAATLRLTRADFLLADLRDLDELAESLGLFDQIICFETIEHIMDDERLIQDLSNLLNPDGRLILTAPFSGRRKLAGESVSESEDGGHVRWGYTHEELRKLLTRSGLQVLDEGFISGVISQWLINLSRTLARISTRLAWAAILPFRVFQLLDERLTQWIKYPYLSVGIVGAKS